MKESVWWGFNAIALLAMRFVQAFPALGFALSAASLVLCVLSFRRDREEPGNPAWGFLGSFLIWTSLYALLIYPRLTLNDSLFLLVQAGCFGGFGLVLVWILRVSWRKREASEKWRAAENNTLS